MSTDHSRLATKIQKQNEAMLELSAQDEFTERDMFIAREIVQSRSDALRDLERDIRNNGYQAEPYEIIVSNQKVSFSNQDDLATFLSGIIYRGENER